VPPLRLRDSDNKYITLDGITIRYIVRGDGSPVVLIHGFGEFVESWAFNIEPLSKHYQVYAVDLPGHGLSGKPKIDYSLPFAMQLATDFMQALGIDRASLIGHSMGGAICLSAAISFPEKIDKIVLVDSGGLSKELPVRYRLVTIPILGEVLVAPTIKSGLKAGMKRAFYNPDLVNEEMVDIDYQYMKMPGTKRALLSIIRNSASLTGPYPEVIMTNKLHLVKTPALLIHGAQDKAIPVEHAQNACKLLPQARLEVFEKCGHVPHIEKAAEFNEAVIAFLNSGQSV